MHNFQVNYVISRFIVGKYIHVSAKKNAMNVVVLIQESYIFGGNHCSSSFCL